MVTAKIGTLLIRTLTKPISSRIKAQAREHERFRTYCISLAQTLHRYETRLRTGLLGEPPSSRHVRPLSEARAIENGANFLAGGFLFAVATALILGESYRSSRSEARRRAGVGDALDAPQVCVGELSVRLERAEDAAAEERERPRELARTLNRIIEPRMGLFSTATNRVFVVGTTWQKVKNVNTSQASLEHAYPGCPVALPSRPSAQSHAPKSSTQLSPDLSINLHTNSRELSVAAVQADVPGPIHEIDSSITLYRQALSILSRTHRLRPLIVYGMASKQFQRHNLSNQYEDLDKAIAYMTEAILLPPLPKLHDGPHLLLRTFFFLARALFMRSKASKQPEDSIYATKYLFHLRDQPHEIPSIPRHRVTALLVDALALQVELDAGHVMQNIREMSILCCELLTLETTQVDNIHIILLIYRVVLSKIRPGGLDQPLDELIEFLQAVRKHRPIMLEARVALAISLVARYFVTCANDNYEEAVSILDEIIAYTSPGHESVSLTRGLTSDLASGLASGLAATLAIARSAAYQTPEYLEEAIYRTRTSSFSSFKELFPIVLDPNATAEERFQYFGSIEGAEGSSVTALLSSQTLPDLLEINQAVDEMRDLIFRVRNSDDTTEIDKAIKRGRSILASDFLTDLFKSCIHDFLGEILFRASRRTNKIEYLNESIDIRRQLIESPMPLAEPIRFRLFPCLYRALLSRSHFFPGYRTQDLDEALEILSQCVNSAYTSLPEQFRFACEWAYVARGARRPSVSTAYEIAMSLMQDALLFSPTLQLQHTTLATHTVSQHLPLDYASYQLGLHQLEKAIETLETGRALLWSEMRHLRASIDQLLEADSDLGHKFAMINRDLEELTKSIPPTHKLSMDDAAAGGLRAVDPFGRLVLKQRGLLKERTELISQIKALPNFDGFLTSPSFNTLRSAALSGPVIIINYSEWRSDILILLHNTPPSLIQTPDDFFKRAGALKDKLLDSRRKFGPDSSDYEETLATVLEELYKLIGQPVIDRLRQLQVPEQSRVWWCPTSVFCSLPLHAMGPIPSDDAAGPPRYFLDLYICSYTPTLSALIQSRCRDSQGESGSRPSDRPSILLVAQPISLPNVWEEIRVVKALDTEVASLVSEAATPATVIDGFHQHRFVHFACHGRLEPGKPFEAGFELYGEARLTLLEIVRPHIPTAEFAFLSACHTAEITVGSIMDEGLHLAAAVQYCGFRSVVGTMWAMADMDGEDLAKHFYKALFSGRRETPRHERSAKALQFAVKKLRKKRHITLERWVNFVHYGA